MNITSQNCSQGWILLRSDQKGHVQTLRDRIHCKHLTGKVLELEGCVPLKFTPGPFTHKMGYSCFASS